MPTILFVCTANQFRSPIAAACFSYKLAANRTGVSWIIRSAGTWTKAGLPAHPKAVEAAGKLGVDLGLHATREVDAEGLADADLIIVMERNQQEAIEAEFPATRGRIVLLGSLANSPEVEIPDPAENNFARSDETALLIYKTVDEAFAAIVTRVLNPNK